VVQEGRYRPPRGTLCQLAARWAHAARRGAKYPDHEIRVPVAVVRRRGDQPEGLDGGSASPAKSEAGPQGMIFALQVLGSGHAHNHIGVSPPPSDIHRALLWWSGGPQSRLSGGRG